MRQADEMARQPKRLWAGTLFSGVIGACQIANKNAKSTAGAGHPKTSLIRGVCVCHCGAYDVDKMSRAIEVEAPCH